MKIVTYTTPTGTASSYMAESSVAEFAATRTIISVVEEGKGDSPFGERSNCIYKGRDVRGHKTVGFCTASACY